MRARARRSPFSFRLVVAALAVFTAAGCYAHTEPAYVEARVAPAYVHAYPSTYYEGRSVYLIDGRWHFYDRGRWVYYRREPAELHRQRVYVERAPRAPTRRDYGRPDYGPRDYDRRDYDRRDYDRRDHHPATPRPRQSAPPARRVR